MTMATSLREIARFLEEEDLSFERREDEMILTGFSGLEHYRDLDGDPYLQLVIMLPENGRYFTLFAPQAYVVPLDAAGPFLQACTMIQWRTKMIQFEYDENDGEVRPVIEFPVEDAPFTKAQVMRCLAGITEIIDEYHPVLQRALSEGVIEFNDQEQQVDFLSRILSGYSTDTLAEALRRADERRRT